MSDLADAAAKALTRMEAELFGVTAGLSTEESKSLTATDVAETILQLGAMRPRAAEIRLSEFVPRGQAIQLPKAEPLVRLDLMQSWRADIWYVNPDDFWAKIADRVFALGLPVYTTGMHRVSPRELKGEPNET